MARASNQTGASGRPELVSVQFAALPIEKTGVRQGPAAGCGTIAKWVASQGTRAYTGGALKSPMNRAMRAESRPSRGSGRRWGRGRPGERRPHEEQPKRYSLKPLTRLLPYITRYPGRLIATVVFLLVSTL